MARDLLDSPAGYIEPRPQFRNHRTGVEVVQALSHDAVRAQHHFIGPHARADDVADDLFQLLETGPRFLLDQALECGRRLGHLMRHDLREPGRPAFTEQVLQQIPNEQSQALLGRKFCPIGRLRPRPCACFTRVAQHLLVQAKFVPKMIIDRSDVGAGPLADLLHRGRAKPRTGKNRPGGFQ